MIRLICCCLVTALSLVAGDAAVEAPPAAGPDAKKEMPGFEVYDFESDWDQNEMGAAAGRVLRGRARRLKLFSILVDMDREAILKENPAPKGYSDDLPAWVEHARKNFDVRWIAGGKLSGFDAKKKNFTMDLTVVDIGVKDKEGRWSAPRVFFAKRFEVDADIDLPKLMEEVLTAVVGPHMARGEIFYPQVTESGANLIQNGTFEELDPTGFALHWEDASMKKGMIKTVDRPVDGGEKNGAGKCMELAPDKEMSGSYGVICYSELMPVAADTAYQLKMNIRAKGTSVIVWVKGYSMVDGRLRNTYKHQKRFYPDKPGAWNEWSSEAFLPKHPKYPVTQMKVMLYAYSGAGTAWFDDVRLCAVKVDGELPKADFEIPDRATSGWKQADGAEK